VSETPRIAAVGSRNLGFVGGAYDPDMGDDSYGAWDPLALSEVVEVFEGCDAPWWITGGHALEIYTGRSWRDHDDTDVGIRRVDAVAVLGHLIDRGWEPVVAAAGVLCDWDGGELTADAHQNNVWCRRPGGPWQLDITIGEGDDDQWIYRRDPSLRRAWSSAVLERAGLRYLSPELQLLFKSTAVRTKDTLDAGEVIPSLDAGQVALLDVRLRGQHPWRHLLERRRRPFDEADLVEIVDILEHARIDVWVDGGWAVDALVGGRTRDHADLDLALRTPQFAAAREALAASGFELVRNDGPHNVVMLDGRGRLVDVHAFDDAVTTIGHDGIERCAGDGLAYEARGFDGVGEVAGRTVRCISPDTLMRYHAGYEVDADDFHDVGLLHERFGIPIPADYRAFLGPEPGPGPEV
jgi:lincosamide nucleotidyltransferase A/C/D/E